MHTQTPSFTHTHTHTHTHIRLSVWGVFWLVRKLLKVDLSLQGWRLRGFESLSIKTTKLELVTVITCNLTMHTIDLQCN